MYKIFGILFCFMNSVIARFCTIVFRNHERKRYKQIIMKRQFFFSKFSGSSKTIYQVLTVKEVFEVASEVQHRNLMVLKLLRILVINLNNVMLGIQFCRNKDYKGIRNYSKLLWLIWGNQSHSLKCLLLHL